jgi:hypothetical protein
MTVSAAPKKQPPPITFGISTISKMDFYLLKDGTSDGETEELSLCEHRVCFHFQKS